MADTPKRLRWRWLLGLAAAFLVGVLVTRVWMDSAVHWAAEVNLQPPGPLDSHVRGKSKPIDRVPLDAATTARLMGIDEITSGLPKGGPWSMYGESIVDDDCGGARYVAVGGFYQPLATWNSMSKRAFVTPVLEPGPYTHTSDQAVIDYPNADDARTVYTKAAETWRHCAGRDINTHETGSSADGGRWTVGPLREERGVLAVLLTRAATPADPPWSCEHALTVEGAVVIDVDACGTTVEPGVAVRLAEATAVRARLTSQIPGYRRDGG